MTLYKYTTLIISVTFLLFLTNCSNIGKNEEGLIEYDIVYLSNQTSVPTYLLPKTLKLKFKGYRNITSIEGFMGQFSITNIADNKDKTNTTLLKIIENKFVSTEKNIYPCFFDGLQGLKIKITSDKKVLAGLECQKAIGYLPSATISKFDIYFTKNIKISNPNKINPYKDIDGVLMQFNIRLQNIEMQLVARKHTKTSIPESDFSVPEHFKKIGNKKLTELVGQLLE